jgi:hypothetical protein
MLTVGRSANGTVYTQKEWSEHLDLLKQRYNGDTTKLTFINGQHIFKSGGSSGEAIANIYNILSHTCSEVRYNLLMQTPDQRKTQIGMWSNENFNFVVLQDYCRAVIYGGWTSDVSTIRTIGNELNSFFIDNANKTTAAIQDIQKYVNLLQIDTILDNLRKGYIRRLGGSPSNKDDLELAKQESTDKGSSMVGYRNTKTRRYEGYVLVTSNTGTRLGEIKQSSIESPVWIQDKTELPTIFNNNEDKRWLDSKIKTLDLGQGALTGVNTVNDMSELPIGEMYDANEKNQPDLATGRKFCAVPFITTYDDTAIDTGPRLKFYGKRTLKGEQSDWIEQLFQLYPKNEKRTDPLFWKNDLYVTIQSGIYGDPNNKLEIKPHPPLIDQLPTQKLKRLKTAAKAGEIWRKIKSSPLSLTKNDYEYHYDIFVDCVAKTYNPNSANQIERFANQKISIHDTQLSERDKDLIATLSPPNVLQLQSLGRLSNLISSVAVLYAINYNKIDTGLHPSIDLENRVLFVLTILMAGDDEERIFGQTTDKKLNTARELLSQFKCITENTELKQLLGWGS